MILPSENLNVFQNMADECQRRCKLPIIDRLNELRNEIDKSIEKLINSKTLVRI